MRSRTGRICWNSSLFLVQEKWCCLSELQSCRRQAQRKPKMWLLRRSTLTARCKFSFLWLSPPRGQGKSFYPAWAPFRGPSDDSPQSSTHQISQTGWIIGGLLLVLGFWAFDFDDHSHALVFWQIWFSSPHQVISEQNCPVWVAQKNNLWCPWQSWKSPKPQIHFQSSKDLHYLWNMQSHPSTIFCGLNCPCLPLHIQSKDAQPMISGKLSGYKCSVVRYLWDGASGPHLTKSRQHSELCLNRNPEPEPSPVLCKSHSSGWFSIPWD